MGNYYISKIKHIIYILLLLISFNGVAQEFSDEKQHQIDSLNKVIANPKSHDTIVAKTIFKTVFFYYLDNPDTTILICERGRALSEKTNFKKGLIQAYGWLGYLLDNKGDIKEALNYYTKCLNISEEMKDHGQVAVMLNNIGRMYADQEDYEKSIEYHERGIKLWLELGDNLKGLANTYLNLASVYYKTDKIDEAIKLFNKSLKINKEIGDLHGIATSSAWLGKSYFDLGNAKDAIIIFKEAMEMHKQIKNKRGVSNCTHNVGKIYLKQGNIKLAHIYAEKSFELAKELGYPKEIESAANLLSGVYEAQGQGIKALEMYKLHVQMKDSIKNEETQKATVQQQAKYEYEKQKVLDDAEHDKLLAIEQEEKEKQQILTGATAGGLGLVVVFLIFVFNRLRITKKQKLVIEEQKEEVEQQKEVVELAHHELEEKNQEIMDSITYAKRIQSAILPAAKVVKEYLKESFILYKPKDVVAGDFYWMEHKDNKVLFAAADCTGHGVPGAMVSVVCNNALNRSVREHGLTDPGEILSKTREIVIAEFEKSEEEVKDGMDIALCSLEGMKLKYAGAHNPLWIIRNGEIIETKANKQPIGQFDNPEPYTTHSFDLEAGDSIYIFSDGYVDQFGGEKGKKFKSNAFRELLLSIQDKAMEEQKTIIDEAFESWRGNLEQIDDVCIIGVQV
jgi:serine phosphatase RsbU (regulator of sigma subunit)/Tfp pilus assembly protein PilF